MHTVVVVALDGVVPFDLATPCEVFGRTRRPDGTLPYDVRVCGVSSKVNAGLFSLVTRRGLGALARADTIIVPGVQDLSRPIPPRLIRALRAAAARGTRIASICTGAFILAAAGLLDGQRATTHWLAAPQLEKAFPEITVDAQVLYVDNGQILTSAGAAAGLDLCLHLVRRDFGASLAADAARVSVMPLERSGGQAQFISYPAPTDAASLDALLTWMTSHLHRPLGLRQLAKRAGMSTRTLSRRFRDQLGTTPAQWLKRARIRRAQQLLETTSHPVERIAELAGFGSTAAFRTRFVRQVGTAPLSYRRAFRAA